MFKSKFVSRYSLVKQGLFAVALLFAGSVYADNSNSRTVLAAVTEGFNPETAFNATCAACHNAGVANAPKMSDPEAWKARMEKGIDAVMKNVLNGLNSMPAKGLCFTCTDDDLKAVVEFMYAKAQG